MGGPNFDPKIVQMSFNSNEEHSHTTDPLDYVETLNNYSEDYDHEIMRLADNLFNTTEKYEGVELDPTFVDPEFNNQILKFFKKLSETDENGDIKASQKALDYMSPKFEKW